MESLRRGDLEESSSCFGIVDHLGLTPNGEFTLTTVCIFHGIVYSVPTIALEIVHVSTVSRTAGSKSSMASALAQIFWVTPSDSVRRKPNPLSRMGWDGVISIFAAPTE